MKLIIAGSRDFKSIDLIPVALKEFNLKLATTNDEVNKGAINEIVSGGARGIDQFARTYAAALGVCCKEIPADWNKYGKSAGYIRNKQMAEYGDELLAIWDGHSKGTLNMITEMKKLNKPVHIMEIYLK